MVEPAFSAPPNAMSSGCPVRTPIDAIGPDNWPASLNTFLNPDDSD